MTDDRITARTQLTEDQQVEQTLRPTRWDEYVGQQQVKDNLQIFIQGAQTRNEALDHVLISGPPGLGKTTLANIIASELGVNILPTAGPVLERPKDLAAILSNLRERDVLFVDEIHRLNPTVEETLYPAMEDYKLDLILGQGPSAQTYKLTLAHFTLIGATTRAGLLTSPLRDRFGVVLRLDFYTEADLVQIVTRSARILNVGLTGDGAVELARRSRGTPRIANRLLRRVRDFAQVEGRRDDRPARGPQRPQPAERGRAGVRRDGSAHPPDHHREVRRRSGGHRHPGRGRERGAGDHRGCVRAVPHPARLPGSDPPGTGCHTPRLCPLRPGAARRLAERPVVRPMMKWQM